MKRIEFEREGHISVLDYTIDDETLTIWHVETPPAMRGRGIAGELVEKARALAEEQSLTVNPVCSYARAHLKRYPTILQRDSSELHE